MTSTSSRDSTGYRRTGRRGFAQIFHSPLNIPMTRYPRRLSAASSIFSVSIALLSCGRIESSPNCGAFRARTPVEHTKLALWCGVSAGTRTVPRRNTRRLKGTLRTTTTVLVGPWVSRWDAENLPSLLFLRAWGPHHGRLQPPP
jgi:hypothetical protein